jgi:hypothetical protein
MSIYETYLRNKRNYLMGLRDIIFIYMFLPSRSTFINIYASIWKVYHEHIGYDPKDGELCLIRSKSGETLMEDRSSSDVQIDCQNWA